MESDGEIEYLDEDADIVQHCVQSVPVPATANELLEAKHLTPLLIERQPASKKKKRKIEEEDSDYDPRDDAVPPPGSRFKKKKTIPVRNTPKLSASTSSQSQQFRSSRKPVPWIVTPRNRRKMNISIPDYDDPLCLPVKAVMRSASDVKKLKSWNNACLAHLKHSDNVLKPEKGITKGSSRTVVLRNFMNKETGKYETAVWAKTCVENESGEKKSQNFQCILPKFSEKTTLDINETYKKPKKFHNVDEVILTKEKHKNEETLVVYKPKDSVSAIYKLIEPENSDGSSEKKRSLRESSCCKMCARCYHASWRGVRGDAKKHVRCSICARTFVSVYNLLAHVKAHAAADVRQHKRELAATLATVVDYHYKCRICQEQFLSIAKLRQHVDKHKGNQIFICEVGNHTAS